VPIAIRNLAGFFVHPRFIAFLNLLLVLNLVHAVLEGALAASPNHDETADIIEGLGIIMIAWGVALEERYKLREVFHLLPKKRSEISYQNAVDENCHCFGLRLLLLGLFAEVGAECVSVPDRIINTSGMNDAILFVSGIFLVVCGVMMLIQSMMLLFAKRDWLIQRYKKTSQH
jgi:succinate dehydrogenase hydrophobic anchor subunit